MGYSERVCQLCSVSFNVGRIRTADEPIDAGWDGMQGNTPVESENCRCDSQGCADIERTQESYMYHDDSSSEAKMITEHLAGPACLSTGGYSGQRISAEEMKDCVRVQCLMPKDDDWSPEPGDESFVVESKGCFVTGISTEPPDEFNVHRLDPARHGIAETMISNEDSFDECGLPMHPGCFELFQRLSAERFGFVDIDGLRELWEQQGDLCGTFVDFPVSSTDRQLTNEQMYECVPGTEYLVANPMQIHKLDNLIDNCVNDRKGSISAAFDTAFDVSESESTAADPFAVLPPELTLMILLELERDDVANLRMVSRSYRQLPQTYFRDLVKKDMPWVWEIDAREPGTINWHQLWCALSDADGGSSADEKMRHWLNWAENMYGDCGWLLSDVSTAEAEEHCLRPREPTEPISKEENAAMKKIAASRRAAGKHWPKPTQIHGLRNRRRIYGDIQEILACIAALDQEGSNGEDGSAKGHVSTHSAVEDSSKSS